MKDNTAKPDVLAIIPARGGSKGIPRKNLRLLCGKPLVAYSIEHALQARQVTRTVVSTDDPEIAGVASQYGAEVLMRPAELATDTAGTEPVLLHVLSVLEKDEGYTPSLVILLQPTSPLRQSDDIDNAIAALTAAAADSLFSCSRSHCFYWRLADGRPVATNYDPAQRPRRQDRAPEYTENGSIYVTRTEILKQHENRLGGRIALYEMDPLDSFEIDTEDDLLLIEQLLRLRQRRTAVSKLRDVRLLALDFDGVMTDNRVLVSQDGIESVLCNRGDGQGIENLMKAGIPVVVISRESNPVVAARCHKLGIICIHNVTDKVAALKQVAREHSVGLDQIAYAGNDLPDIACIAAAGVGLAVADAYPEAKAAADIVTQAAGGAGAVREICDMILESLKP